MKKKLIVASAIVATVAAAVPALADTTFYGSARLGTFWDTSRPGYAATATAPESNTDFDLRNQATSRVGINVANDNFGFKVELGLGGASPQQAANYWNGDKGSLTGASIGGGGNSIVYTRLLYGTYKFDFGTLLVGQTYTPYWQNSEQVAIDDQGNNGFGSLYDGRQPQIKLTLSNGAYIAAIRPGTPAAGSFAATAGAAGANIVNANYATSETLLPKLALGYDGKFGDLSIGGGVAGQIYKNQVNAPKQVFSALGYVHGKYAAGPASLGFNVGLGRNLGDMGITEGLSAVYNGTDKKFENNLTYSVLVTAGYVVSPTVKVNAGLGYVSTDGKYSDGKDFAKADNRLSTFVNAPITLAKNVTLVPEVTYQDNLDDNKANVAQKGQRDVIYGAKWQFDF